MANEYKIALKTLFAQAFGPGNIPALYKLPEEEAEGGQLDYSGMDAAAEETVGESWLGTPVYFRFGFRGGSYQVYQAGQLKERALSDFQLPAATMVELSRAKRLAMTPTVGGKGAVVEMYGFNPWGIRIRGICLDDPGHPQAESARDQRNRLAAYAEVADAIELQREDGLFSDLDIYALVVRSVRFGQVEGRPKWYPFELDCISDEPLELLIN